MIDSLIEIPKVLGLEDEFCNVVIGQFNNITHLALVYKDENKLKGIHYFNNKIQQVDYGFLHHKLFFTTKMGDGLRDLFPDNEIKSLIPIICNSIIDNNANINFSFDYFDERFDEGGNLISNARENIGLTCSTFVLSLFNSDDFGNIKLLDVENWETNEKDLDYMDMVCNSLCENTDLSEEQKLMILKSKEGYRFRPEDVFLGFKNPTIPMHYRSCREVFDEINNHILDGI